MASPDNKISKHYNIKLQISIVDLYVMIRYSSERPNDHLLSFKSEASIMCLFLTSHMQHAPRITKTLKMNFKSSTSRCVFHSIIILNNMIID